MKTRVAFLMAVALLVFQGCGVTSPFEAGKPPVLIAPAMFQYKNSAPGLKGYTDAMNLLTGNGMTLFGFAANWSDLEPSPGTFNLQDQFLAPLTLLLPQYAEIDGVVFVLKMIDTNIRPMPQDIQARPFDDPEVIRRFEALIDALAAEPSSSRLTHILLGNEVNGYLSQHPEEFAGFVTFYQQAVERIHERMPGVKVSTIINFPSSDMHPGILGQLSRFSDFVCYTYYPIRSGLNTAAWQMRPVSEIRADIDLMAQRAGEKSFAFTEIGYSSSAANGSSEEQQAEFVREMFRAITDYQQDGRLAFLLYHALYDYPPDVCIPYAEAQGVDPDAICGFMESLGLRRYDTGEPRKAWDEFVQGIQLLKIGRKRLGNMKATSGTPH